MVKVEVKPGYQPPPPPREPDTVVIEMSREDAEALGAMSVGLSGPSSSDPGNNVGDTVAREQLRITVYETAQYSTAPGKVVWTRSAADMRDRLRSIGGAVRRSLHLGY